MEKQKGKEVPTRPKEGDSKMSGDRDKSKTHKLSLKGSALVVQLYKRYPDFCRVVQDGGRICTINLLTSLNMA